MTVFLNGRWVPEERAVISVFDRSFLYGDGLFETIRIYQGRPFRWSQHGERLGRGAKFLKLNLPFTLVELEAHAQELIRRNQMPESILRINLSRGVGTRGYSTRQANRPNLVMSLHPAPPLDPANPPQWRLMTSSLRVPIRDLAANHKTCNKLTQILARAEAEAAGADEALLLNTDGKVAEAASGNLFWMERGTVCTTPLAGGVLAGITRALVLELCPSLGLRVVEKTIFPKALAKTEGSFLTLTSLGIVELVRLDGHTLRRSGWVDQLRDAYRRQVEIEIGQPHTKEKGPAQRVPFAIRK